MMTKLMNENEVIAKGKRAKFASFETNMKTTAEKNEALLSIADQLVEDIENIMVENQKDLQNGQASSLSESVLDRILLDETHPCDE